MEYIIREAFKENNWELLKDILKVKNQFQQIEFMLEHEQFRQLVAAFELIEVKSHSYLQLSTSHLYYFVTGGLIALKKVQKSKKYKNKKQGLRKRGVCSSDDRSPRNFADTIPKGFLSRLQDFLDNQNKPIGFYYSTEDSNIVLRLKQSSLAPQVIKKIKQFYNEKLRFLNRLQIFSSISRTFLQQNISKFIFAKITFNELVYQRPISLEKSEKSQIFVLMKGDVIIQSKSNKGIIINAPAILGLQKEQYDQARCVSEYSIGYKISINDLETILKNFAQLEDKQYEGINYKSMRSILIANYLRDSNGFAEPTARKPRNTLINQDKLQVIHTQESQNCNSSILNKYRKNKFKSIDNLKKDRIKEHFSNFINEKYQNYTEKINKNLDQQSQTPILYRIKPLVSKIPNYETIKNNLKTIRLKKIVDVKQKIAKSSSSQSLLQYVSDENQDFFTHRKTGVFEKMQRNLQTKIALQISKKYGTRMRIY